MQHDTKV